MVVDDTAIDGQQRRLFSAGAGEKLRRFAPCACRFNKWRTEFRRRFGSGTTSPLTSSVMSVRPGATSPAGSPPGYALMLSAWTRGPPAAHRSHIWLAVADA